MHAESDFRERVENLLAGIYETMNASSGVASPEESVELAYYRTGARHALRGVARALGVRDPDTLAETGQPQEAQDVTSWREPEAYDYASVRRLLRRTFTAKELRRFVQDRPLFRPILDQLSPQSSLQDTIDVVIETCEKRDCFGELLREVYEVRPRQYARHIR